MKTPLCYVSMNLFKIDFDYINHPPISTPEMMLSEPNRREAINIH